MTKYDFTRLNDVLDALYASLSGPPGERSWDLHQALLHPQAQLVRTGVDENGASWLRIMTPRQLRDDIAYALARVPFYEMELDRRVEHFGNIAQVWSAYVNRRAPSGPAERRGVHSIQLFRDGDRKWRIVSMSWDHEREGVSLPN